ncbi:MAG: Hsp20 family protein [Bacilli bacterium]|nr:Hsp20 family protein [Bacilli bacterium]
MNLIPKNFFLEDVFDDLMTARESNMLKCDIYEKDGNYYIEMDADGFKKEDLKIDYDKGYLIVAISKAEEVNDESKNYIRKERVSKKMQRSFYVGESDINNIKAELTNGLLKITIPKREELENKKTIEIE